jgi:hypothetical protein
MKLPSDLKAEIKSMAADQCVDVDQLVEALLRHALSDFAYNIDLNRVCGTQASPGWTRRAVQQAAPASE